MFQGEPSFKYGNIHEFHPEAVAQTVLFGRIEEREQRVLKTCSRCAFFDLCYGMLHVPLIEGLQNGRREGLLLCRLQDVL